MPLHSFLDTLELTVDPSNDYHCSNSETEKKIDINSDDNIIVPLTHYALLAIDGPDTATFLQGQTTCDVTTISDNNSSYGAYCTPKGRMISSFLLARHNNNQYFMRQRHSLLSDVQTRLSKYIVFSKAELCDASDQYLIVGISGNTAKATISNTFQQCPNGLNNCINSNGNLIVQLDQQGELFECWLDYSQLATLWPALSNNKQLRGSKSWELLMIRQGLAEITQASSEHFIPQMLNYHLTGAISFNKGCYTGQEIIARMHYKGKAKRNLYHIVLTSQQTLSDTKIYDQKGKPIGDFINVVETGIQKEGLAVISDSGLNDHDLLKNELLTGNEWACVRLVPLPYAITNGN